MPARLLRTLSLALLIAMPLGCQPDNAASSGGRKPEPPIPKAPALPPDNADGTSGPPFEPNTGNPCYALLIACSKYDYLPASAQLRGPVNDVPLMTYLLTGHYGFPIENIRILAEDQPGGYSARPLRANIEREFKRFAEIAGPGARMVVYFSGHGAQQPNDNPDDPKDPEPDGLDEILCSADVKPSLDPDSLSVPNAVVDDELHEWLGAIRDKGASIWVVIDACHSGTAIRGTEVLRQLPPEMLISREALQKAASRVSGQRGVGVGVETSPFETGADKGGIVAVYAAQPHEPTIELPLPIDGDDRKWRGLLTYTLVKVLSESAAPVTYTELVQRIHREYVASLGRLGPVPLVEGSDRHREVLGTTEWKDRSRLVLQIDKQRRLTLNAGSLHRLTPGTILAVYPPAGGKGAGEKGAGAKAAGEKGAEQPLGHVRIARSRMADSDLEPCEFNSHDLVRDLPEGGNCQVVRSQYGDLRLRVAIDAAAAKEPSPAVAGLRQKLASRAAQEGSVFELVEDLTTAQWLVRPFESNQVVLVPAGGWVQTPEQATAPQFGPAAIDDKIDDWLHDRLSRIARANNLLKIAGEMTGERKRGLYSDASKSNSTDLRAELVRLDSDQDTEGKPVEWRRDGVLLKEGELMAVKLHNASRHAVDFTVLFVDSSHGIKPVYPSPETVVDNRLGPDGTFTLGPLLVEADSVGLEHLIIIALKADGPPVDFSWLSQDSLEQARAAGAKRGSQPAWEGPLGQLFQQALYAPGQTRGLKMADAAPTSVQSITWRSTRREQ